MARSPVIGPVVLDCEGLARLVARDRYLQGVVDVAGKARMPVVTNAVTIVEAVYPGIDASALNWALSKIRVVPATKDLAAKASKLLMQANLHGHKHALDALLCATALELPERPVFYTSDPADILKLVGTNAAVVPLR